MAARNDLLSRLTCPRGHPYDYIDPDGGRRCTVCDRITAARRKRRLQEEREKREAALPTISGDPKGGDASLPTTCRVLQGRLPPRVYEVVLVFSNGLQLTCTPDAAFAILEEDPTCRST